MNVELERFLTYKSGVWTHRTVWPQSLAKSAFYYSQSDDSTVCFSCGLRIQATFWHMGDRPDREHAQRRPSCEFVLGFADNVPWICRERNVGQGRDEGQGYGQGSRATAASVEADRDDEDDENDDDDDEDNDDKGAAGLEANRKDKLHKAERHRDGEDSGAAEIDQSGNLLSVQLQNNTRVPPGQNPRLRDNSMEDQNPDRTLENQSGPHLTEAVADGIENLPCHIHPAPGLHSLENDPRQPVDDICPLCRMVIQVTDSSIRCGVCRVEQHVTCNAAVAAIQPAANARGWLCSRCQQHANRLCATCMMSLFGATQLCDAVVQCQNGECLLWHHFHCIRLRLFVQNPKNNNVSFKTRREYLSVYQGTPRINSCPRCNGSGDESSDEE